MYTTIVSKAQYRWLYMQRSNMVAADVHYDRRRNLSTAQIDYLLKTINYEALPDRYRKDG